MYSNNVSHSSRGFGRLIFPGVIVLLMAVTSILLLPHRFSQAAEAVNMNCSLVVPAMPLTAQGLSTPYQLVATDPNQGACHEANTMQAAFVQAAVIDPANGQISVYSPLVVDQGIQPAVAPVVPQLPAGGMVAIWFGFNGNQLTLQSNGTSLQDGMCVNGTNGSIFGQFAYCNTPAFFGAANNAIMAGQLVPPALGVGNDGLTCPTVRDFGVVDMDQSDNVTTAYLVTGNGQLAQATAGNMNMLQNAQLLTNASDNGLLDAFMDPALGCHPWVVADLASPGQMTTALPLDELQAGFFSGTLPGMGMANTVGQAALVPNRDPMVLNNNMQPDLGKLNAYRTGVDQPQVNDAALSSTKTYCMNLRAIAPMRLQKDQVLFQNAKSPNITMGSNLFTFLAQRFKTTYEQNGLNCMGLLNMPDPVNVQFNGMMAVNATFNQNTAQQQQNNQQGQQGQGTMQQQQGQGQNQQATPSAQQQQGQGDPATATPTVQGQSTDSNPTMQ